MLFRPGSPPPGVFPDEANTHTTSTSSIGEWYASFFGDASVDGEGGDDALPRRMECTVRAGEVLFIPRGWWHMAVNLEETLALTQNYASAASLPHVLDFIDPSLSSREAIEDKVSGIDRNL